MNIFTLTVRGSTLEMRNNSITGGRGRAGDFKLEKLLISLVFNIFHTLPQQIFISLS